MIQNRPNRLPLCDDWIIQEDTLDGHLESFVKITYLTQRLNKTREKLTEDIIQFIQIGNQ